jgi:N-acetylglucosamine-6-phosphate deacetylase
MPKADLLWLCPDHLFDGERLLAAQALGLRDSVVEVVVPQAELSPRDAVQRVAGTLSPGFIDLQVNGGGGILLNNTPTPEALVAIAAAHRPLGTVALLPTVITDRAEVLGRAVEASLAAKGARGVIGLHIEGPHLSLPRRGTHDPAFVRPFEPATLAHVQRLRAAGIPVMITVAPESVTPEQIAALAATGAVVSLGHTDTDAETIRAALKAGATCFTHLFNAMSPMLNRAPGVTGAAINSTAYAGIICDGIHVADEMVGLAIRARPVPDRMFLVSDAMATVGGPGQLYPLWPHDPRAGWPAGERRRLAGRRPCHHGPVAAAPDLGRWRGARDGAAHGGDRPGTSDGPAGAGPRGRPPAWRPGAPRRGLVVPGPRQHTRARRTRPRLSADGLGPASDNS